MKRTTTILFFGIIITTFLFFYKTFFFGLLPFPGDLFVAEYQPWKNESFLGYVSGSYPNKAQYFDALCQMIPWKIFSWDSLKTGIFPLWNPHNFSGTPHLANIQAALLYPFTYLGTILPYPTAWTIIVIVQPLLAGLFMILFMQSIGVMSYGAFFAAIAFALSQFMTVFLEYSTIGHVVLWLPFSLFSIERYLHTKQKRFLWFLALSVVLSAFAGHLQLFAASSIFIFLYTLLRSYEKTIKRINIPLVSTLILSLGISAVQLLPTLELATLAARVPHDMNFFLEHLLIQPKELFLFLSPDAFGNPATRNFLLTSSYPSKALSIGLAPLLFALGAIIFIKAKNSTHRFFIYSTALLLVILTNNPISWLFYHIPLSMLTSSSPSNIQYLLSFSLAVLSGIGLQEWIRSTNTKKWSIIFVITPFIVIGWIFLCKLIHVEINIKNIFLTLGIAISLAGCIVFAKTQKQKMLFVCFILLITIGERFYIHNKFNPFSPKEFFYPPTTLTTWLKDNAGIYRFWGYGHGTIAANVASGIGLYDMQGYDPLYPKQYGEFIGLSKNGTIEHTFTDATRSNAQLSVEKDLMANPNRLRLLSLGGVKYILDRMENGSTEKTFPASYFTNATSMNGWNIMENKNVTPRAFLTSQYSIATSPTEYELRFVNEAFSPTQTVILDRNPDFASTILNTSTMADIKVYTPNKVIIETQTDKPSLLVLTDTYYPGWTATIDGNPAQIYRADYTYRAIAVPEGTHTVIMQFKPLSAITGFIISISSILILLVFILLI
ncbi:MAG: YfhO family protein [Candidatus Gottesmanbacteria bacterium]